MPPRTRAGSRVPRFRPGFGRMGSHRIAWLRTYVTREMSILALNPLEYDEEHDITMTSEPGTSYVLSMQVPGRRRPFYWNFSAMTEVELKATREFFTHLFDLADPIVRERDKVAHDANDQGDDSYVRVYRDLPQFVIREREERQDSEGIRE